jgi:hypothetical protein
MAIRLGGLHGGKAGLLERRELAIPRKKGVMRKAIRFSGKI